MFAFAIIIMVVTVPGFRTHIFALDFVDEDDNIVIGNLIKEGKILYKDVFTQHQPTLYYLSTVIQKATPTDNILMTIKRHREFMIIWSVFWVVLLTARFGWTALLPASVLELVKILVLGNLFLAESLVIYPLVYFVAYIFSQSSYRYTLETLIAVVLFWGIFFSLAPLWPLLVFTLAWLFTKTDNKKLLGFATLIIGLLTAILFINKLGIRAYYFEAIYTNYKYYIPQTTSLGLKETLHKAFFAPVYTLITPGSTQLLLLLKILSFGFILEIMFLIRQKKYRSVLLYVTVLGLASLRYIAPDNTLYGAFHMLPWFALLIYFNFIDTTSFTTSTNSHKIIRGVICLLVFAVSINIARTNLWDQRSPSSDYYIHYSPSQDIQTAVSILSKNTGQSVWVEPVMYWPYWHTGASEYSTMVNYYDWMDSMPPLKQELQEQLKGELPTIVWAKTSLGIGEYLGDYIRLSRDGQPIDLYLRSDKIRDLSADTLSELEYYRFKIN